MTNEISIKTTQHLPFLSIFSLDGQLYQVAGYGSDYTVCYAIDDDGQTETTIDLDVDAIQQFIADEEY